MSPQAVSIGLGRLRGLSLALGVVVLAAVLRSPPSLRPPRNPDDPPVDRRIRGVAAALFFLAIGVIPLGVGLGAVLVGLIARAAPPERVPRAGALLPGGGLGPGTAPGCSRAPLPPK